MKTIALNFFALVLLLGSAELFFRTVKPFQAKQSWRLLPVPAELLNHAGDYGTLNSVPPEYQYHPDQTLRLRHRNEMVRKISGDKKLHDILRLGEDGPVIFDVTYDVDESGWRQVEDQKENKKAQRFVLALGCSLTFGHGVAQGSDYPSQLAKKLDSNWRVYNFGKMARGPSYFLDLMEHRPQDFSKVTESEGVFVWFYFEEHMTRLLCPWACYQRNNFVVRQVNAQYDFNGEKFVWKAPALNQSPDIKRRFFEAVSGSDLVQRLGFISTPEYSRDEYEIFAKSLETIIQGFSGKKFLKKYIAVYKYFEKYPLFKEVLSNHGFEVLEYFVIDQSTKNPSLIVDLHPSSETYWYLSEVIKNKLKSDFF